MDPAKSACDMVTTCWDHTANYRKYVRSLGDNLACLESKTSELDNVYGDVRRMVESAEGEGWKLKNDPARWLTKVEDLKGEASRVVADGRQMMLKSCLCGICFINCRARYHQSKLAEAKKAELETELARGRGFRAKEDVVYEPADLILERSLRALKEKSGKLRDLFETVKLQVKREEERHMVRTPEVSGWLRRVEDLLEKQVVEILEQGKLEVEKVRSHGGAGGDDSQTQRNFRSYHGISKRADEVSDMLKEKIKDGRGFVVVASKPDDPLLLEIPIDRPVGAESMFKEVWNWVEDETVKCIGLFGMGGVGKTHMLYRIHNKFLHFTNDYNFVVWVVVSRPINLDEIQEAILQKSKLPQGDWKHLGRIGRVDLILSFMKDKNFLLFLDDLWDPIDLQNDVGIPCIDNPKRYKIIFTTRQERVCNGMKANRTKKVDCLSHNEAVQLFRQNLGENVWSARPWIRDIAESLVYECKYLPLAIKTVAGAMNKKTVLKDWMKAEEDLRSRLSKFEDMEEKVLVILEFSYDRLPDETHKKCFLYLSIFPEDHEICMDEAIDLWIGEGFLEECADVHEARDKGERIFRRLKDACLLDFVRYLVPFGEYVKMHDVVREMALWVYSNHGMMNKRALVHKGEEFKLKELEKWKGAERISLWKVSSESISPWQVSDGLVDSLASASHSHLSTLIMCGSAWDGMFRLLLLMPCLRVLDITDHSMVTLPDSIWKMINLRYLKVISSQPVIINVPVEIGNLNKLEVLIVSSGILLPLEAMPKLSSLRVFQRAGYLQMFEYLWSREKLEPLRNYEIEFLPVLQKMKNVVETSLSLVSQIGAEMLLGFHQLARHLRQLTLCRCDGLDSFRVSASLLRQLENLQILYLIFCNIRHIEISCEHGGSEGSLRRHTRGEPLAPPKPSWSSNSYGFQSLTGVLISQCPKLIDVTSLVYHAPALEALDIFLCPSLEELIADDVGDDRATDDRLFPSLKYLYLASLNRLGGIYGRALPFPSLEEIKVSECPNLTKLPLNCDSAKNSLRVIQGEEKWWGDLDWDHDPTSKQVFSAKFIGSASS